MQIFAQRLQGMRTVSTSLNRRRCSSVASKQCVTYPPGASRPSSAIMPLSPATSSSNYSCHTRDMNRYSYLLDPSAAQSSRTRWRRNTHGITTSYTSLLPAIIDWTLARTSNARLLGAKPYRMDDSVHTLNRSRAVFFSPSITRPVTRGHSSDSTEWSFQAPSLVFQRQLYSVSQTHVLTIHVRPDRLVYTPSWPTSVWIMI